MNLNFSVCVLRNLVFRTVGRSHVVQVFQIFGKRYIAKGLLVFFSVVSIMFEKLVSNSIVDHFERCGLLSDFQYDFASS